MVTIEKVALADMAHFRQMVEAYWQELMPKARVITDLEARQGYFQERFTWEGGNNHPHWAITETGRVGFMVFNVSVDQKWAGVEDFYVVAEARRQGYFRGSVTVLSGRQGE